MGRMGIMTTVAAPILVLQSTKTIIPTPISKKRKESEP